LACCIPYTHEPPGPALGGLFEGRTPKGRDGKPIEGHHKQPVEDHPDLADYPDNIEFVDWPDHLDAHGKSPRK